MITDEYFKGFITEFAKNGTNITYGKLHEFIEKYNFREEFGDDYEEAKRGIFKHIAKYYYLMENYETYLCDELPAELKDELNIDGMYINLIYKNNDKWIGVFCVWKYQNNIGINKKILLKYYDSFNEYDHKLMFMEMFTNISKLTIHPHISNLNWKLKTDLEMLINKNFINFVLNGYTPNKGLQIINKQIDNKNLNNGILIKTNVEIKSEKKVKKFYTEEDVKKILTSIGYTLNGKYTSNKTINFKCNGNGDINKIHEGVMTLKSINQGHRCKKCSILISSSNSKTSFVVIQNEFSSINYTLLTLENEYKNVESILKYICDGKDGEKHENETTFPKFKKAINKCKKCKKQKWSEQTVLILKDIKNLCEEKNLILLTTTYNNRKEMLQIQCKSKGHETTITVAKLEGKYPCVPCSGNFNVLKTIELIKEEAENNGFILHSTEYNSYKTTLKFTCPNGHLIELSYKQWKASLTTPYKCGTCARKNSGSAQRHSYDFVIEQFNKKNFKLLTPNYINAHQQLEFICDKNHNVQITFGYFYNGQFGCPVCDSILSMSKGEIAIENFLKNINIEYKKEHTFKDCKAIKLLRFDVYVNKNFLIEYDGGQHFFVSNHFGGQTAYNKRIDHDIIKTKYCITNKIPLLRISYNHFKDISSLITKFIESLKSWDMNTPFVVFSDKDLYKHLIEIYEEETK